MPLLTSPYRPSRIFRNGHFSTVYAGLVRKVDGLEQHRERLELGDGDFLDLDWSYAPVQSHKLVLLLHGLEGSAQRAYITGSAKAFLAVGFDACAVNFRSCSGETNRLFRSYHSGATEDLEAVLDHILSGSRYKEIVIKGFSLGGNLALRYLGERGALVPPEIKAAIGVSVPCDLYSSLKELLKPKNLPYAIRFKKDLIKKLREKQRFFPGEISDLDILKIRTLKDFDDIYTSRAHGFSDALDYYEKCSCLPVLEGITVPTLILNARNDSFLGPECYPVREAQKNDRLFLEVPHYGGHVGFYGPQNLTYSEKRATNFIWDQL
tara:strand:- start:37027 stop:37992 length:966 start_codon:yes stop_codon:yes gene_type:complete